MASLQARHRRDCALGKPWTPFERALAGCTCPGGPGYYVVVREGTKVHRQRAGKNRRQAERALTKAQATVDEGSFAPQASIRFADWGERWLASLERKQTTIDSYRSTTAYANAAFADRLVRRLSPADIQRMNTLMREAGIASSTRAKHLRVLAACLNSAIAHGYAARNPVKQLPKSERPRAERKEAAYFENQELPRLIAALEPGIFRILVLVALKTGMRQGELLALAWADVDLSEAVVRVRRSITDTHLSLPKNHERRDVDLTTDVVALLADWRSQLAHPALPTLVFPGGTKSGHLGPSKLVAELYGAMRRADVPRIGPTGEKRTFHSLRHTFAKRALESGRQITWLSRHLGHSTLNVTTDVYGHWERAERKRETALMEGVFGV